jgi:hypothetical protein
VLLTAQGHRDAWRYTYRFFKIAGKVALQAQKAQIVAMSAAVGLCFAEEKDREKFLKGFDE